MPRMTKRDFIVEVAKRTDLRRDVVEDVFESIVDTAIEEIVNTGDFSIKDLFSVSAKGWKGYSLDGVPVKPQMRLTIRLSEKIKGFWKLKNEKYSHVGRLSRQQLDEAMKYERNSVKSKTEPVKPTVSSGIPTSFSPAVTSKPVESRPEDYNPMLDDED